MFGAALYNYVCETENIEWRRSGNTIKESREHTRKKTTATTTIVRDESREKEKNSEGERKRKREEMIFESSKSIRGKQSKQNTGCEWQ